MDTASTTASPTVNDFIVNISANVTTRISGTTTMATTQQWSNGTNNVGWNMNLSESDPCPFVANTKNITLICVFTVIFCLSVIGNSVIIVIITQQRWMRTVTNVYLLNLAVADLLLSVVCMPPTLTGLVLHCFVFPTFVCPLLGYFQPVAVTASMYTLTVIAIERYYAICRPLHSLHWQTQAHAWRMITFVWVLSFIVNLPWLFLLEAVNLNDNRWNCRPYLEGNMLYIQLINMIYITIVMFLIPAIVMVVLYSIVIHTLRAGMSVEREQLSADNDDATSGGTSTPSSPTKRFRILVDRVSNTLRRKLTRPGRPFETSISGPRNTDSDTIMLSTSKVRKDTTNSLKSQNDLTIQVPLNASMMSHTTNRTQQSVNLRSTHTERSLAVKKRVIMMLVCVVIEFFICWTPLYTWLVLGSIRRVSPKKDDSLLTLVIRWTQSHGLELVYLCLAYISSCCNPITYCFLNQKFRHAALYMIGCGNFTRVNETTTRAVNTPAAAANLQRRASAYAANGVPGGVMNSTYISNSNNSHANSNNLSVNNHNSQPVPKLSTLNETSEDNNSSAKDIKALNESASINGTTANAQRKPKENSV